MSGEEWSELHFDNCRIPARERPARTRWLQEADGRLQHRAARQHRSLARIRPLRLQQGARARAATRQQFGRPLCEFQGLQWKFAEMAIKLEGAQLLLYRAAANADRGLPSAYETAVAKVACNQAGFDVAQRGGADHGSAGLQPRKPGRMVHAPLPRLDDRRRIDRDAEEPHRRACVRPPLRSAPAEARCSGGGMTFLSR